MGAGDAQTYTLLGLTPGTTYDLRIYIRSWDTAGSGRPTEISVDDGNTVSAFSGNPLFEDKPDLLGYASIHSAYYLNYRYTAFDSDIDVIARLPLVGSGGSFHMHALSNQIVPEPGSIALMGIGGLLIVRRRR